MGLCATCRTPLSHPLRLRILTRTTEWQTVFVAGVTERYVDPLADHSRTRTHYDSMWYCSTCWERIDAELEISQMQLTQYEQ